MTGPDPDADAPASRDPLKLRTEWTPFGTRWDVILSADGLAWQRDGSEAGHWVRWELIGGVSNVIAGQKTPSASILALDGSSFGSIEGLLQFDGESTSLSHAMALYRPDLFVEVEGFPWTGGCIRREVTAAEHARMEP
ncbi:MAG TPA: hypothetical protein VFY18_08235 [Candidatus Limnocylindrales bacterium]|nr:hypothetical protein [Candidatus Limnocylindrales bacterium]